MKKTQNLFCRLALVLATLFFAIDISAQTITGTVMDEMGEVTGASVVVKGTTTGATTDFDGKFSVQCKPGATLVISFVGYVTQEVPAADGMVVTLVEDSQLLEDVVVIGYGTVKKEDATGSIATLKADPKLKGVAPTADNMLVGKIAGVTVTTGGGSSNSGSSIRIRGGSSLSASNDPLIILDGVYLDNEGISGVGNMLSTIDPNDIESFTVLKDASATAIYGSRASNGVILITTKKGKSGNIKITYDANVSMSHKKKTMDVLSGTEFQDLIRTTFANESNREDVYFKAGLNSDGSVAYNANTDWQEEIFQMGVSTEHNLSALGSIGKYLPFRASLGYTRNEGILKTDKNNRYTANLALNPTFLDTHLKVNLNGKVMKIRSNFANGGAIGAATSMDPTKPVYDANSKFHGYWTWTSDDGNIISVATKNPVSLLEAYDDHADVWNFIGSAQIEYNSFFVEGLKANLNLSMDYASSEGESSAPHDAPSQFNSRGYHNSWSKNRNNQQLDAYVTYAHDFKTARSHFDIMGGYSWQKYHSENDWYTESQFDENLQPIPEYISEGESKTEHFIVSFFTRMNYSFANRYLLTFTLRSDGSSRFSKDNRWGVFPSAAFSWRVIEEDFLKDQGAMSDLKLRLGWGQTGQQDINMGDYPYLGSYSYSINNAASYMRWGEWSRLLKPNAYNSKLKWETTTTWNAGIDYGFLNQRINGALDFYYRETKDLINAEAKVPAGANFAEYVAANIGSLSNTGVEFSVNSYPIQTRDFVWELNANVAWNKNKIISLTDGDNATSMRRYGSTGGDGSFQLKAHTVGNPAGMFYVYEQVYDNNGKPLEGVFVDRNNDGALTEDDLYLYHKADADFTYGMSTKFQYKKWDLAMAGHGSWGNWIFNGSAANNAELSAGRLFANSFLSNRPQSAFDTNFQAKTLLSDYYIQNGAFFRIDNISIGYSFEKLFGAKISGRVSGTVQNPFVFTAYKGLDPEIGGGVDNSYYPRPITYMIGLNLNF